MTDAPTDAQIAALKLAIDAGTVHDVHLGVIPDIDGAADHGWLTRDGETLHVTPEGWHVLKRADGVEAPIDAPAND